VIRIIRNLLPDDLLSEIRAALEDASFLDGKLTALGMARNVKNNLQLDGAANKSLIARLTKAITIHPEFRLYVMPVKLTPIMVSRYDVGMEYGIHSDNNVISGVRTDVSFTLFLENPAAYEGGELAIDSGHGETKFKLPAGWMVMYPSGPLHRVTPVTTGRRLAAVGWAQSWFRDARQREIVAEMEYVRKMYLAQHGHDRIADLLLKSSYNLQRIWIE
jgi:PKHD-type hydroxylase